MQLPAQVAFEVMSSHGARTASRLRGLVTDYAKTYGITDTDTLETLQAEALAKASRLWDFKPDE